MPQLFLKYLKYQISNLKLIYMPMVNNQKENCEYMIGLKQK